MFFWVFLLGAVPIWLKLSYVYFMDRYEDYMKTAYTKTQQFVILRVFPPAQNINSMHRMEDFFNSVWSMYRERTPYKLYTLGRSYETMTMEFHSIGGYVGIFIKINKINQEVLTTRLVEKFPGTIVVESADPLKELPKEWTRKGKYTQIYSTDMKTIEITTKKETDLFPLKSWTEFQTDNNQPIADPATQLFGFLQNIDPKAYVVIQFVLRPLVNRSKLKEWMVEYQSRKKELLGEEDLNLSKRQKILTNTKVSSSILNGVTRKMNSLNYICKIRAVAMAEPGIEMNTLEKMIASFFVQFQSEIVKIAPQHETESDFSAGGNYLGILGPQIDIFLDKTIYERERYFREKIVYDGLIRRHLDVGSKAYYLDTQSLASMIHFPFVTPETAQARNIKVETSDSNSDKGSKYQHLFKPQPPDNLPF